MPRCLRCCVNGSMVRDTTRPCNNDPMSEQQISAVKQANGMAIASLVLGVVAAVLAVMAMYLAPIPALLAIIFGSIGNSQAKHRNGAGHSMSLWGVLLGFMPLLIFILSMSVNAAGSMR